MDFWFNVNLFKITNYMGQWRVISRSARTPEHCRLTTCITETTVVLFFCLNIFFFGHNILKNKNPLVLYYCSFNLLTFSSFVLVCGEFVPLFALLLSTSFSVDSVLVVPKINYELIFEFNFKILKTETSYKIQTGISF